MGPAAGGSAVGPDLDSCGPVRSPDGRQRCPPCARRHGRPRDPGRAGRAAGSTCSSTTRPSTTTSAAWSTAAAAELPAGRRVHLRRASTGGTEPTAGRVEAGRFGAYGDAVRYTDSVYTEAWDGYPDAPPMLDAASGHRSGRGRRRAELRRLRRPLPLRPRHRLLQHRRGALRLRRPLLDLPAADVAAVRLDGRRDGAHHRRRVDLGRAAGRRRPAHHPRARRRRGPAGP